MILVYMLEDPTALITSKL